MQITIVVDDKLVMIDRKPLQLDIDWSVFDMDPANPDGAVTVDDLLFFLVHFEGGC